MSEIPLFDSSKIRLDLIKDAYNRGMRFGTISPDSQIAPWLINGLRWLEEGKELSKEDIVALEKMGGTDHPDPWFG